MGSDKRWGLLLGGLDDLPDASGQRTTYEGTYDEDPEVGQGCATLEDGGSQRAGGVDTGAGVADADEVDEHEAQTDGQSCKVVGGSVGLGGSTQHYEYEDAGEDDLSQQSAHHGNVSLQVVGSRALQTGNIGGEQCQQCRADECADALEDDVHAAILGIHASAQEAAESDGGIDVASGYSTDGVGHSHHSQSEGQGGAHYGRNIVHRITTQADSYAAAHEYEHHSAHHFS